MEEDAIKYEYTADFRKKSERLRAIWQERVFDEISDLDETTVEDTFFQELVSSIMKDVALARLYVGISFSRMADEAIRQGMVHDVANTILREGLVALSQTADEHEIQEVIENYHKRMRVAVRKMQAKLYTKVVKEACEIIHFKRHHKISTSSIAKELGVNASALSKKFKAETGKTVTEYILEVKMEEAQRMQKSGIYTLEEISDSLGFPNYAYFSRRYKTYFGENPSKHIQN